MRHIERILVAMALAISATMLIPASAAQAGPGWVKLCIPGVVYVDGRAVWDPCATEIDLYLHERIEIPCPPGCGLMLDFWDRTIDWDLQLEHFERWDVGLETLAESRIAEDPGLAKELRSKATEHLLAAAEARKGFDVPLNEVAWIDVESGKIHEGDDQLLWEVAEDLLSGQQWMLEAVQNPKAIAPAMEAYDSALARLDQAKARADSVDG